MLKLNEEIMVVDTITKLPIKIVMKVDSENFINSLKKSVEKTQKNDEFFADLWEETRKDYFDVFVRDTRTQETRTQYLNENHKKAKESISLVETALLDKQGELTPEKLGNKMAKLKRKPNGNLQENTELALIAVETVANYVTSFAQPTYVPTIELKVVNENEVHIIQNIRSHK